MTLEMVFRGGAECQIATPERTTISHHLEPFLAVEIRGGDLETRMYSMISDVNDLLSDRQDVDSTESSPPMFSSRYVAQFGPRLWDEVRGGIRSVAWPDRQFFASQGCEPFVGLRKTHHHRYGSPGLSYARYRTSGGLKTSERANACREDQS